MEASVQCWMRTPPVNVTQLSCRYTTSKESDVDDDEEENAIIDHIVL